MPKLLDFLKENKITHDEVIKTITALMKKGKPTDKLIKPEDEIETPEVPDTEDEQIDKPDLETENSDDLIDDEGEEESEDKIILTKEELDKLVEERVVKKLKIKRKVPSKGKIRKIPTLNYEVNIRGYEVKTERSKKK